MSEKPVTRAEFEALLGMVRTMNDNIALLAEGLVPSDDPEPPPELTGDFDSEVESLCLRFAGRVMNALDDGQKGVVMEALNHYVELTRRNNDGLGFEPDEFIRAFREALNHAPEGRERNLLREVCLILDGGLPSPIRSRADVFGYVEPVVGSPGSKPSSGVGDGDDDPGQEG